MSIDPREEWLAPETTDGSADHLLDCLVHLTRHWQCAQSQNALLAGLPLENNRLTPELVVRAAERAGLDARVVQRPLQKVSAFLLPAILLLKGRQACVLLGFEEKGKIARVFLPDAMQGESRVPVAKLCEDYLGYAILARPVFSFDTRSAETTLPATKHWFWSTVRRFWPIYSQVAIASLVVNLFALASPLFTMNVYDRVVPNSAMETLWVLAFGITAIFGFDFLIRTARGYLLDSAGKKADVIMANTIFQHVLSIRMAVQPASAGALARHVQEFESIRDFFTSATLTTVIDLPFVFLFLWVMGAIGGNVVLVPMFLIPAILIVSWFMQKPMERVMRRSAKESSQKNAILTETLTGLETIRILGAEGQMQRKWEHCVGMTSKSSLASRFLSMLAINFSMLAQQLATVGVVVVGVHLIAVGDMTTGALFACTMLSSRAMSPLGKVAGLLTRFQQSHVTLGTLNTIMKLPAERSEAQQFLHRPKLTGDIVFQDVIFSYPGKKTPALANISFRIRSGERVGFIGRIGSGKSTLFKLILGLYHAEGGAVLMDGADIRQLDPADLRRNIGCVPQESVLFFGTIRENITLGNPWADMHAILRAAELGGVTDYLGRQPNGFDMMVGEQGRGLSGGQRQTVAIARALVGNPQILLMDEPTSSMDRATEARFLERIAKHCADKTLLLVTHKAALLTLVDRLIVVEGGKVLADGPKEQVLKAIAEGRLKTQEDVLPPAMAQEFYPGSKTAVTGHSPPDQKKAMAEARKAAKTLQKEDRDFISMAAAARWQGAHPMSHWMTLLIAGFFAGALYWAWKAELDEVTVGIGKVIPSSQVQVVQILDGGIVTKILAKEGEEVQKGQVLLSVDDTQVKARWDESRQQSKVLMVKIARLTAEANGLPFRSPAVVRCENPELVASEEDQFRSNKKSLENNTDILLKQADQREQELVELKAVRKQLIYRLQLARDELELTRPLVEKKLVSEVELLRLRRGVSELESNLESTVLAIPRVQSVLMEAKDKLEKPVNEFRSQAFSELNKAKGEFSTLKESIRGLEDLVARTEVLSPVSGTVIRVNVSTVGQVVKPGVTLVEIMPREDFLLVEARIRPEDIGFLHPKQKTTVKFTAYDFSIYGGMEGSLDFISADTLTNEKGESYYQIRVRTVDNHIGRENEPLPIIPGMVATVDILTGKKSVLDYLLKPILKAKEKSLRER